MVICLSSLLTADVKKSRKDEEAQNYWERSHEEQQPPSYLVISSLHCIRHQDGRRLGLMDAFTIAREEEPSQSFPFVEYGRINHLPSPSTTIMGSSTRPPPPIARLCSSTSAGDTLHTLHWAAHNTGTAVLHCHQCVVSLPSSRCNN
ncbi:hypothetical protein O3P69_009945 [Scylla paramamosain]|uniref:Uncharacterized protein n=1 Tax=Scylla paramamosain TaxID=85552 RepID=A0AAW0SPM9_SCYPA